METFVALVEGRARENINTAARHLFFLVQLSQFEVNPHRVWPRVAMQQRASGSVTGHQIFLTYEVTLIFHPKIKENG